MKQTALDSELASLVGAENVFPGSGTNAVDGVVPQAVVHPASYDGVAQIIRHANAQRLAVIPLGGRVHAGLGNVPARFDLALDTTRLDAVVEFEPGDLTITCQAGTTLGALRKATAADGLMVPFDPAVPDAATAGGVLAANVWGPARISLGSPRDFTIGMRVVTGDGLLTRAGGKVVKNVAGYDMCKLYIGSLGTLGVIVEATFKTIPLAMAQLSLGFEFDGPDAPCGLANEAYTRGLAVSSAVVERQAGAWRLRLALAGTPAAVQRSERDVLMLADGLGGRRTEAIPEAKPEADLALRIGVLPSKLPALLAQLEDTVLDAYPVAGACRVVPPDIGAIPGLFAAAARLGGTCVIERCPPDAKRQIDVFGDAPPSLRLMRALKRELDPNRVLSPGRMVERI